MKFLTGALTFGFMIAGFAASTPVRAVQICEGCVASYEACVAAGGNSSTCWKCNNPTCQRPTASDPLKDALGKLSSKEPDLLTPANKRLVATRLDG